MNRRRVLRSRKAPQHYGTPEQCEARLHETLEPYTDDLKMAPRISVTSQTTSPSWTALAPRSGSTCVAALEVEELEPKRKRRGSLSPRPFKSTFSP